MNKIIELLINFEEFELDDLGVEIMSLVDRPAIEVNWMAFSEEWHVDNTGFEKFADFFEANQDLFSVNNTDMTASGGMNHKEMTKKLEEAGVNTGYPFGFCYPVSQFMFYMLGGYASEWDLKCAKKMAYSVNGVEATTTHWFIQNRENGRIVDLTASQFEGLLDVNEWYPKATRANLGFPYYNVDGEKVMFDNTVPSLQVLKVYDKWREENGELPELEVYYQACRYEELRKKFTSEDFSAIGEFQEEWEKEFEKHILKVASEVGQPIDPEEVIYIDANKSEFATLGEYLQGIRALDVLDNLTDEAREQDADIRYRYAGPSGQRTFCATMKALNRIYSRQDITLMNNFNPGFGAGGSTRYSVFDYKGGPNCRHYWEELVVYNNSNGREVIVSLGPARGDAGQSNNRRTPSPTGAVANNAYLMSNAWAFSADDKQIITGPAMIPNQLIPRKDEKGNLFHVYFSEETIEKIARKFLADNNSHNTDINHNGDVVGENTLLESWIVKNPEMDQAKELGFNVPKGTWMTSYKINNKETWNKIKAGELNGFSVTGNFLEKLQNNG